MRSWARTRSSPFPSAARLREDRGRHLSRPRLGGAARRWPGSSSVHLPWGSRAPPELGGGGGDTRLGAPPVGGTAAPPRGSPGDARPGDSWPRAAGVPSPWPLPPPASLPRFRITVTQSRAGIASPPASPPSACKGRNDRLAGPWLMRPNYPPPLSPAASSVIVTAAPPPATPPPRTQDPQPALTSPSTFPAAAGKTSPAATPGTVPCPVGLSSGPGNPAPQRGARLGESKPDPLSLQEENGEQGPISWRRTGKPG